MCKSTTDTSVMECKCVKDEAKPVPTFGNSKLCQHNQHPAGCPWCELDRLRAENETYRTKYVTRTAYDAVSQHRDDLRAELDEKNAYIKTMAEALRKGVDERLLLEKELDRLRSEGILEGMEEAAKIAEHTAPGESESAWLVVDSIRTEIVRRKEGK